MSWQTDTVTILRNMIGDTSDTPEYTDCRLLQVFMSAATLVLADAEFAEEYDVDISGETITPDPSDDLDFIALCCLKAACMLTKSELRSKYNTGKVSVKDGPSTTTIDNTPLIQSMGNVSKSFCEEYDNMIFSHRSGNTIGVAVLTPYSPGSDYVGRPRYPNRNIF